MNERVWCGKFINILVKPFTTKNGKTGIWECVERVNGGRSALIFPVTTDGQVVLVKQYRYPVERPVISLPAGLSEDQETTKATAGRELLEETGYRVSTLYHLMQAPLNPGVTNDIASIYYAPDVVLNPGPRQLDELEELEVVLVPLAQLASFCLSSQDLVDMHILAALKAVESLENKTRTPLGQLSSMSEC